MKQLIFRTPAIGLGCLLWFASAMPLAAEEGDARGQAPAERGAAEAAVRAPIPETPGTAAGGSAQPVKIMRGTAVDGGPAAPREELDEVEIRRREAERARMMAPREPIKQGRTKAGRVSWTERYELGPRDELNFGLGTPFIVLVHGSFKEIAGTALRIPTTLASESNSLIC